MKKSFLTSAPAVLFTADEKRTALNVKMGTAYEVQGGWYRTLEAFIRVETGVRVIARSHGPRMSELFGLAGDLNTMGIHLKASQRLTEKQREQILKAVKYYLKNIVIQRTCLSDSKFRAELRTTSTSHKEYKAEGINYTVYGITKIMVVLS